MRDTLARIRRIEKAAYPPHMWQLQWVFRIKDLAEYCECRPDQVFVLTGQDWYLLAAEREDEVEVVDFASIGGCRDILRVLATVVPRWRGRRVVMDARESTSYRLVMLLVRRYRLDVIEDELWFWGDEPMHSLVLDFPLKG